MEARAMSPSISENSSVSPDTGSSLHDASRIVRAIVEATSSIHAIKAMLRGVCDLSGATSASIGISTGGDDAPELVATETGVAPQGVDLARLVYPLDLDHPVWRSASLIIVHPAHKVNDVTETRITGSLMTILGTTLMRLTDAPGGDLFPATKQAESLSDDLWEVDTVESLRENVAGWLGEQLNADFVMVRTRPVETRPAAPRDAGSAYWPHEEQVAPQADGASLRAEGEIEGGFAYELAAGRHAGQQDWTLSDRALFNTTNNLFARHLKRISDQNLVATQTRYLSEMQELTASAAAARNLPELCEIVNAAVTRFLPGEHVQIQLDVPEQSNNVVFGYSPIEHLAASTLEADLCSQDSIIGTIRVQSAAPDAYGGRHEDILKSIAQSTVGAFERHILLVQIARQARYESGLRLVAERVNATLDAAELIQIASDVIFDTIRSDLVVVATVDQRTRRVRSRSHRSVDVTFSPPPIGYRLPERSLSTDTILQMQQVVVDNCSKANYTTFQDGPWRNFSTAAGTPIAINDEITGIITVGKTDDHGFTESELSLQRQIAAMLSTALENAYSYAERVRHARDLGELQRLSARIASQLDLQQSLDEIALSATNVVRGDGGVIALLEGDDLEVVGSVGSVAGKLPERFPVPGSLVEPLVYDAQPIAINDFMTADVDHAISVDQVDFTRSLVAVPLLDPEVGVVGLISVFSDEPRVWTARDISLLTTLSSASAIALQNARHFESTRDLLRASVESLAAAVEAKDPSTQNHSRHVAGYARIIAEELGLSPDAIGEIELAGLLHDVGKIGIPDSVLEKPGPLDPAEWAAVHLHPIIGEQILSGNPTLRQLLPMVRHHHERWDGNGYPDRLSEHHIPAGSAIIAVAESFDTMTTHRTYQPAKSWSDAVAEVQAGRGTQFAPFAVDAFTRAHMRGKFSVDEARVASSAINATTLKQHRAPSLDVRALRIFEAVANEIHEGTDLAPFIRNVTHELREIIGVPYLAIYVRPDEREPLALIASSPALPTADHLTEKINAGLGVVGWVARYGVIQNIPDVTQDNRYLDGGYDHGVRSELCVPLFAEGHVIGVMNLESDGPDAFSDADERLMISAADHIANAIHVVQLHERLRRLSSTDALTGLQNHRAFFERLVEITDQSIQDGSEVSVAIMDVDNLKAINDSYGHLAGDAALRSVADVLVRFRRPDDVVCRYGGDEYALILPGTSRSEAWSIMESLAVELLDGSFKVEGFSMPLPTSSWGIATAPEDSRRAMELLAIADERMYLQKTGGRG